MPLQRNGEQVAERQGKRKDNGPTLGKPKRRSSITFRMHWPASIAQWKSYGRFQERKTLPIREIDFSRLSRIQSSRMTTQPARRSAKTPRQPNLNATRLGTSSWPKRKHLTKNHLRLNRMPNS